MSRWESKYKEHAASLNTKQDMIRSKEEGDNPSYTDSMFNFVPGSAFEIGASLAILDHPGRAGRLIDNYAKQLSALLFQVYETSFGDETIIPNQTKPTEREALKTHFNRRVLSELRPSSDQIGRCLDEKLEDGWIDDTKQGLQWLIKQLNIDSNTESYDYKNMLTKLRAINAVGGILRDLMSPCNPGSDLSVQEESLRKKQIAATMLGKPLDLIEERIAQIRTHIFHPAFNDPVTRGRSEKIPKVFGRAITDFPDVSVHTVDAAKVKLGFGRVFHSTAMTGNATVIAEHERLEKIGRQAMPRLGQDIKNLSTPGLLGESSQRLIPQAFQSIGLQEAIDAHAYEHGSGLNRWQLTGQYSKQSWDNNLPAAGSQSATTTTFFTALNCLGAESLFGNPDALQLGLIVASFMNVGGYHSFVETFPIAQAVAKNVVFAVQVSAAQRKLYTHIKECVAHNGDSVATALVSDYLQAYALTITEIKSKITQETIRMNESEDMRSTSLSEAAELDKKRKVWSVPTVDLQRHIQTPNSIRSTFTSGQDITAEDLKYTILDTDKVVFRDVHELAELAIATKGNKNPKTGAPFTPVELVSFRPERIALHQAIATVITSVQYQPKTPAEAAALEHDPIFIRIAQQVIVQMQTDIAAASASLMETRIRIEAQVTALLAQIEEIDATEDATVRARKKIEMLRENEGNDLINKITSFQALIPPDAELGDHVAGYNKRKALIALTTDAIYAEEATKTMTQLAQSHVCRLAEAGEIAIIEPPRPEERKLFLIAGGQASGKGSAYALLKYNAEKSGRSWPNVSKGGGDTFRRLLLDADTVHPELFSQLSTPEASYVSHTIVKGKLDHMAQNKIAPDIFIEQLYLGQDKIDLALTNEGAAHAVFVSTDIEKAIDRAFQRGEETGRYENVKGILSAHRGSTMQLPERLIENAGKSLYVTIVDNNGKKDSQPVTIAQINCLDRTITIFDPEKMLNFIKKTAINVDATSAEQCYDSTKVDAISISGYLSRLTDYTITIEEPELEDSELPRI
ncbi:MAG: hypothetical protein NTU48_07355 [Legionellales bacterium]|nr:hypothetical protein [Legionellales bacterium]